MSSGDTLFILTPQGSTPPATLFATLDTIAEGSAPPATIPVLDFDGAQDEHMDWHLTIPSHYSGDTGFTFSYKYALDGSQTNAIELEFRVLQINDGDILTADLLIDGLTSADLADTTAATPTNKINVAGTVALAKANMSTPAAGDRIIIRVTRDFDHASNTDDVQLVDVLVSDT